LPEFSNISSPVTDTIVHLNNGYYQIFYNVFQRYNIYLLLPVFSDYSFENSYLENSFDQRFGRSSKKFVISENLNSGFPIHDHLGRTLFSITENTDTLDLPDENMLIILMIIFWFISFNLLIYNILEWNLNYRNALIRIFILVIAISGFRLVLALLFSFFDLRMIDLLNSQTSGFGVLFPNLFDFILNSISLFFIAIVFSKSGKRESFQISEKQVYIKLALQVFSLIFSFLLFVFVTEQIIYHSSIPLFFNSLYDLNI
jgi:hypothetical protein